MNQGPEDPTDELGSETGASSEAGAFALWCASRWPECRTNRPLIVRMISLSRCYSAGRDDSRSYDARPERSHDRTSARVSPPSAQRQARK